MWILLVPYCAPSYAYTYTLRAKWFAYFLFYLSLIRLSLRTFFTFSRLRHMTTDSAVRIFYLFTYNARLADTSLTVSNWSNHLGTWWTADRRSDFCSETCPSCGFYNFSRIKQNIFNNNTGRDFGLCFCLGSFSAKYNLSIWTTRALTLEFQYCILWNLR